MVSGVSLQALAEGGIARLREGEATLRSEAVELDGEAERLVMAASEAQAALVASRGAGAFKAGIAAATVGRQVLSRLEARKRTSDTLLSEIDALSLNLSRVRDTVGNLASDPERERRALVAVEAVGRLEQRLSDARAAKDARVPAFLADPLYRYLSDPARRIANPLARTFDRWLARVSDFEAERRKHDLLEALPGYLSSRLEAARTEVGAAEARRHGVASERFHGTSPAQASENLNRHVEGIAKAESAWLDARALAPLPDPLGTPPLESDDPASAARVRTALAAFEQLRERMDRNTHESAACRGRRDVLDDLRASWTVSDLRGTPGSQGAVDAYAAGLTSREALVSTVSGA